MKTPLLLTALRHGLLLLLLAGALHALPGAAQTPPYMTYQGYLTDGNGNPYATNGPQAYDIVFRIWPSATGGSTPIYGELQTVTVANGYFSVLLGQGNSYVNNGVTDPRPPLSVVFTTNNATLGTNRYVEMTVKGLNSGADVTILPRLQLVTAPYAFLAANASALVNPVTGNTVLSISGTNLTLNGAFSANSIIGNLTLLMGGFYLDNSQEMFAKTTGGSYEPFLWPRWSDNAMYLNYGTGGFHIRNDNSSDVMFLNSGGSVGIDTTAPAYTLDVNGSLHAASANITGGATLSGGNTYLNTSTNNSAGNVAIGFGGYTNVKLAIDTSEDYGLYIFGSPASEAAYLGGTVEVDGPFYGDSNGTFENALEVDGGSNPYLSLYDYDNGSDTELGIATGTGNWSSSASAGDAVLRNVGGKLLLLSGSGAAAITITTGNLVGIGTTAPRAGLDVEESSGINGSWSYFDAGGSSLSAPPLTGEVLNTEYSGTPAIAIYTSGNMGASVYYAFSDARLKNILGQSSGEKDLRTLMGIKITDYTFKDAVGQGGGAHKKVIAQQVEKVYPQAVSKTTGVVPDIYKQATVKDGWVQLATDLKVGERVKLIGEQDQGVHEVLEVRAGAFRTDFRPATEKVFVFGREVKDLRNVDYDAISMLNVSATQELARRLEALEAREAHVAELEQKAARVASLEDEVADLKQMVTQLAAASKHAKLAADTTQSQPSADGAGTSSKLITTASLDR